MSNFNDVSPLYYWVQKVLPLVYDDSLGYYELLNKVIKKLNDLIKNNASLPAYIQELIESYITSGAIEQIISNVIANFMLNVKYPPAGLTPAVGDGTADDTLAIQGCIDYAYSKGGGCVYFPSGNYLTGSLTLKENVTLYGFSDYNTKLILKGGATSSLLIINSNKTGVRNLTLNANSGAQVNNVNGITLNGNDCVLENISVLNSYIFISITSNSGNTLLNNIYCDGGGYKGILLNGTAKISLFNVTIKSMSGVTGDTGIEINSNYVLAENINIMAVLPKGVVENGNYCKFSGVITNSVVKIVNSGQYNNNDMTGEIHYMRLTEKYFLNADSQDITIEHDKNITVRGNVNHILVNETKTLSGTKTTNADGLTEVVEHDKNITVRGNVNQILVNETKTLSGTKTTNADGLTEVVEHDKNITVRGNVNQILINETKTLDGTETIIADSIHLKPDNPLNYYSPSELDEVFKTIPFRDYNNIPYDVIVKGSDYYIPARKKQYILLSDSYGESPDLENSWITYLKSYADIPTAYSNFISGGGFGSPVKLLTALQNLSPSIADKNSITDIIIGCGYNDTDYISDITAGIQSFSNYVKSTYVNANCKLFLISLTTNATKQSALMTSVLTNYKNACQTTDNVYFIEGSQYIFHRYDQLNPIDGIHPINFGSAEIARGICGYITGNKPMYTNPTAISTTIDHSGINTATNFTIVTTDFGENVNVILGAGVITCTEQTLTSFKEIGTITTPVYIRGLSGTAAGASIPIGILVSGVWKTVPATIIFQNGKLFIQAFSLDSVTQIWLPQLNTVLSKAFC